MNATPPPDSFAGFAGLFWNRSVTVATFVMLSSTALAAPPPTPLFEPDGGTWPAPLRVKVRSTSPDAMIHVTLDGSEPTQRDTEAEPDLAIVIDQPLTLKAKAWLPDGSVSATKTAVYGLRPVQGNGASFIDQDSPVLMVAGNPHRVSLTFRNIGTTPWTPSTHALAPFRAKDAQLWKLGASPLAAATPTWAEATFRFTVTAPAEPGTYSLRFRMQAEGEVFGEPTPTVRVAVLTVEEFERESRAYVELVTTDARTGEKKTGAAAKPIPPLGKGHAAALAKAQARSAPVVAGDLERLVQELQRSPRSFRYLRTIKFRYSDADFTKLIAPHPDLFRSTRIVRRDENGQRIIPGWPGIALAK